MSVDAAFRLRWAGRVVAPLIAGIAFDEGREAWQGSAEKED